MKLPEHKCSLSIEHNDMHEHYENVAVWLEEITDISVPPDFKSPEDRQRCIDANDIWTMCWYPNTPVCFHYIAAPTLEALLSWAEEYESRQ